MAVTAQDRPLYAHADALAGLERAASFKDKLAIVHGELRRRYPFLTRVAVASYDAHTGLLRTFAQSGATAPLVLYETPLAAAGSLRRILGSGRPRVVDDLSLFDEGTGEHTARIREHGYRASYTLPLSLNGLLWGFVFFNCTRPHVFTPEVLADLDVFGHLVSSLATHELSAQRLLAAALNTAAEMVHQRDAETGGHLQRMARFARLIAVELARHGVDGLDDEFIERVFLFAPLHDVGKIAIPDRILRKRGRLSGEEFDLMKSHAAQGAHIVERILGNFHLGALPFAGMLRQVAELHHEAVDGTGYPHGLRGEDIPLVARIVAVADVFDALSSGRAYKPAWPNDQAFATLRRLAGRKLDRDCVQALLACRGEVEAVQERFRDQAIEERRDPWHSAVC
jgi:hypothetical protein